jgi:tetratricopeptide (TPR) repeat protein
MRAEQDYAAAFREARIDVDTLSVKEAAERITARGRTAAAVLPAFDDWVAVRSKVKDEAATRRLIDVLRTADSDPWRQRVRDCLARKDWAALEILARSPDLDRQPAATISFLCAALRQQAAADTEVGGGGGGELGHRGFLLEIDILRRAQWKYPADYWINHRLGASLIGLQSPDLVAEGIGYMRAAVALRPQEAHAIMNLGGGYAVLRQHDQAIACFRKALELSPNYSASYYNLGDALGQKGLHEEAIAAFEHAIKLAPADATAGYSELAMIFSNCPDARLRNPRRAAELADKAVELEPQVSNHWTALGIARYRESQWQEARSAFDKSLQLGTDGRQGAVRWADAIDWFFLAMSNWQLGQKDQAHQCYDRAVESMEKQPTHDEQLYRIRAEAEELLKITDEKPTTKPQSK